MYFRYPAKSLPLFKTPQNLSLFFNYASTSPSAPHQLLPCPLPRYRRCYPRFGAYSVGAHHHHRHLHPLLSCVCVSQQTVGAPTYLLSLRPTTAGCVTAFFTACLTPATTGKRTTPGSIATCTSSTFRWTRKWQEHARHLRKKEHGEQEAEMDDDPETFYVHQRQSQLFSYQRHHLISREYAACVGGYYVFYSFALDDLPQHTHVPAWLSRKNDGEGHRYWGDVFVAKMSPPEYGPGRVAGLRTKILILAFCVYW